MERGADGDDIMETSWDTIWERTRDERSRMIQYTFLCIKDAPTFDNYNTHAHTPTNIPAPAPHSLRYPPRSTSVEHVDEGPELVPLLLPVVLTLAGAMTDVDAAMPLPDVEDGSKSGGMAAMLLVLIVEVKDILQRDPGESDVTQRTGHTPFESRLHSFAQPLAHDGKAGERTCEEAEEGDELQERRHSGRKKSALNTVLTCDDQHAAWRPNSATQIII
ncbi:hypothetical protein C8R45DRAFT_942753 [Mycena sanguinolenta]|nr:hypothetical protein C8R45DRAFT_942753 [Mycena sanguinolenta]